MYPPLQNFIRLLEKENLPRHITILTTAGRYKLLGTFKTAHPKINILRLGQSGPGIGKLARLYYYFIFYACAVLLLLFKRPATVLYYETLSSFPAWFYKKFINRSASIMVHYHEYTSPGEYEQGMFLTRLFHRYEKWLYPRLQWLSHTNAYRMNLFLKDIYPLQPQHTAIVPNYPPSSWYTKRNFIPATPLQIVYIGSMSLQTMYTKEMAGWVLAQQGKVFWDIYSYNITDDAREYIRSLNSLWIQLKEGLDYAALPDVLVQYHIGVVLYKGHIANYVYNAPNKLFEYLSAGLQVWVPDVMTGAMEYADKINVLAVNFSDLQNISYQSIRLSTQREKDSKQYLCEASLEPMINYLRAGIRKK